LYSPDLMVQVTVTGQLALLMLIESLADIIGVEVVSANTDGVTIRCRRDTEQEAVDAVKAWEHVTGFETERANYSGLYSRDVNNYVAVKTNGEVKTKGAYGSGLPLHKNPYAKICSNAVIKALTSGTGIADTVEGCQDIRQFVCIRTVKGGALHRGIPIGKVARWYYGTLDDEPIRYAVNNYLVPDTYGAVPCVELPKEIPGDLDRQWYINTANEMLADLGVTG
jgi:hypothetical protein